MSRRVPSGVKGGVSLPPGAGHFMMPTTRGGSVMERGICASIGVSPSHVGDRHTRSQSRQVNRTVQTAATGHSGFLKLGGGQWKCLAPVFVVGLRPTVQPNRDPIAMGTVSARLPQMVRLGGRIFTGSGGGVRDANWPNTGATSYEFTFSGSPEYIGETGEWIIVADPVYPSDLGLIVFEETNRDNRFLYNVWYQTYGSGENVNQDSGAVVTGGLPVEDDVDNEFQWNAPRFEVQWACQFADSPTNPTVANLRAKSSAMMFRGTLAGSLPSVSKAEGCFAPTMWIGVPVDPNEQSLLFLGDSTGRGEGEFKDNTLYTGTYKGGGASSAAGPWVTDFLGWPCRFLERLDVSLPGLRWCVGASALVDDWADKATLGAPAQSGALTIGPRILDIQRRRMASLGRFFTMLVVCHGTNDAVRELVGRVTIAEYAAARDRMCDLFRLYSPGIKIVFVHTPRANGNMFDNASQTEGNARLSGPGGIWESNNAALAAGKIDYIFNGGEALGVVPGKPWAFTFDNTPLRTDTAGTGATTTNIPIVGGLDRVNKYANQFVVIGGVRRRIQSNTLTSITISSGGGSQGGVSLTAFPSAPAAGDTVIIERATSYDGIHFNWYGAFLMAQAFRAAWVANNWGPLRSRPE